MKLFKKSAVIIAAALSLILAGCASAGSSGAAARDPEAEYQLVVLHTNDHHGAKAGCNRDGVPELDL